MASRHASVPDFEPPYTPEQATVWVPSSGA
jgi:hypothetical protein